VATFTDEEINNLSKDVLDQPVIVQEWQDSYDGAVVKEAEVLDLDNQNKKFFDDNLASIAALISSSEDIHDDKRHFPNNNSGLVPGYPFATFPEYWTAVQPLVLDSNNGGTPVTVVDSTDVESLMNEGIKFYTNVIKVGWNHGDNEQVHPAYVSNTKIETPFSAGWTTRFVVGGVMRMVYGSDTVLVRITAVTTGEDNTFPDPDVPDTIEFVKLLGTINTGDITGNPVELIQKGIGFDEDMRQGIQFTPSQAYLDYLKDRTDEGVVLYKAKLNTTKAGIQANTAPAPYKGQNEAQIAAIDQLLSDFAIWEALPSTVASPSNPSRFDDANLAFLDALLDVRLISDRPTEIHTALGVVTQDIGGAYSGSGMYFQLFLWIDKRINVGVGSLSDYKSFPASQTFYLQQIALATNIMNIYNLQYTVIQFSEDYAYDSENPSVTLKLLNVTGLNINDSIKIMDNSSPVFDRTITFVNTATNEVIIDSAITQDLSAAGQQARIFREN